MTQIDISIIVCTFNRALLLQQFLKSVAELNLSEALSVELLVVDNASTDQTREVVENSTGLPATRYLYEAQQGKSYALNQGLQEARGKLLIFTDDDVRLDPLCLSAFWSAYQQHGGNYDWFGGCVRPDWQQTTKPGWVNGTIRSVLEGSLGMHELGPESRPYTQQDKLPIGALMAMSSQLVESVGEFRTDLGPSGGMRGTSEDTEYILQAGRLGMQGFYVSDAVAHHFVDPSRLTVRGFYEYGYAKGLNARRWKPEEHTLFSWRLVADQAIRGLYQLFKFRQDTVRVCILNIGFEFGKRKAERMGVDADA